MMLYKYRSLSTHKDPNGDGTKSPKDYTLELLKNNELYLSSPAQFNDPFDCYIPPIKIQGKQIWEKYAADLNTNYSKTHPDIQTHLMSIGKSINYDTETPITKNISESAKTLLQGIKNTNLNKSLRIFSLSEKKDNILLWAHYADSFYGICLGFISYLSLHTSPLTHIFLCDNIVNKNIKNHWHHLHKSLIPFKVDYNPDNKLPKVNMLVNRFLDEKNGNKEMTKLMTTKHINWRYEHEYRLITNTEIFNKDTNDTIKIKFNKDILKEIIFGFDCKPEDKEEIKEIVKPKYKQAKFYKCVKKPDEYGVNIVPDE